MYKYKISVIMPVYNSASYIGEAIDSIVSQSIGFESIQLIIVNDGSSDNSAEIIKSYKEKHPESITYIEKENGGVSSARNEALKHIKGKYVAFLDPDDTVSPSTYADAFAFFEENYDKTNVVSFPIYFFGNAKGAHPLNAKFERENRVIDLDIEGEFQLHITSSLIKNEIAREMHFKSELVTSEDAEALLRILIDTPRLGTVNTARYNYRRHGSSLISSATQKRGWYSEHIKNYFNSIMDCSTRKYGYIPRFIQNAMMYDLSWKLLQKNAPACLTENERRAFFDNFYRCISALDDGVIMSANLPLATKYHLISKKYGDNYTTLDDDVALADDRLYLSMCPCTLEFVEDCVDKIKISSRVSVPASMPEIERGVLYVNGHAVHSVYTEYEENTGFLGECIVKSAIFEFELDKSLLAERSVIYLGALSGGASVVFIDLSFGKFCPLVRKYPSSFARVGDFAITYHENALIAEKTDERDIKKRKKALLRQIWHSNGFAERKAVIARSLASIYKRLHKKPLWIISDRLGRAGDNGEALFEHLNKTKFKDASVFFAIRRGEDYSRLKKQGRVVNRASLKYKVLFLASDVIISSHAEDFVINPFDYYSQPYKDILCKKKFVFLQHGVTKDDLSSWLNRYNKNIKGFVTSSPSEHASIVNGAYRYTENEVWLTGMPRFDTLQNKAEKLITILPTWRRYLADNIDISTGDWKKSERVKNSKYVAFWNSLLNDERLTKAIEKHGYRILLVPHPNMKEIVDFIDTPRRVSVAESPSYRQLYEISALMITDYSSAVFDLAYLEKPIIYAQFDKDEFFSGIHSYNKGYFDYEKNGFGKVTYTLDETVEAMIQCIENECKCEQVYVDRINEFFAYRDKENCARVVKKIKELGAKNDKCK